MTVQQLEVSLCVATSWSVYVFAAGVGSDGGVVAVGWVDVGRGAAGVGVVCCVVVL